MNMYNTLRIEIREQTAIITIDREEKLNALNSETLSNLSTILDDLERVDTVRGIILTGAGTKSFVAGADITEFMNLTAAEASALAAKGQLEVMDKIAAFPKPVIAGVNGFALGGGLELAMACHIRVGVPKARFGLPEVSLGIIPGYGGTQRLCQLIGRGRALEMIMTGEMISSEDALSWGLINYIVPDNELIDRCIALLNKTYQRSPQAISFAIEAVNVGLLDHSSGYRKEIELFGKSFGTPEALEGIQAFIEKRKPKF